MPFEKGSCPAMTGQRIAAFFDLDGTMITANSGMLWIKHERRLGRLNRRHVALGIFYMALYRFRLINMLKATQNAVATIKGRSERELAEETARFYENEVRPHIARGCRPAVETHRREGHRLVLLTSSSRYESESVIRDFGFDDYLCTLYEVVNGVFTGEVIEPLCYGEGKVTLAERYAEAHDIDLDQSYFYTDSCTDLPMLERVGNPRVVMPDPRLRRAARQSGWPVLDWR